MGLSPKQITAAGTSRDAKAAASTGLDWHRRSVRSPTGVTIGDDSAAQPPCWLPAQRMGLSARRFILEPTATNPAADPTATVGMRPPKAPVGSATCLQSPPSEDQATGASVARSQ